MAEDCLTLNIFTNKIGISQTKPQAVMVWIHGGGFSIGSKDMYRMQEKLFFKDGLLVVFIGPLHIHIKFFFLLSLKIKFPYD